MERRLGKIGTAAFITTAFIDGCSPVATTDAFINCKNNPRDYQEKSFDLKINETIDISAITKSGDKNVFEIGTNNNNELVFGPKQEFNGERMPQAGALILRDENFMIIETGMVSDNKARVNISLRCNNSVSPNGQQA